MPEPNDPLYEAERQMVEHERDAHRRLMGHLVHRLGVDAISTPAQVLRAITELMSENPQLRDDAELLAVLQQFRDAGIPGAEEI